MATPTTSDWRTNDDRDNHQDRLTTELTADTPAPGDHQPAGRHGAARRLDRWPTRRSPMDPDAALAELLDLVDDLIPGQNTPSSCLHRSSCASPSWSTSWTAG